MNVHARAALNTLFVLIGVMVGIALYQLLSMVPMFGMAAMVLAGILVIYWLNLVEARQKEKFEQIEQEFERRRSEYQKTA